MKLSTLKPDVDGLYHRTMGFPVGWTNMLPRGFNPLNVKLTYGSHANHEALVDRYGEMNLPTSLTFSKESGIKIIEMEVIGGRVVKMVIRKPYDKEKDIIIVFNTIDGFVRTVWFNEVTDKHNTLDRRKYKIPVPT